MQKQRVPLKTEPETDPNIPQQAVALKYDMERDTAPKVVAKGRGQECGSCLPEQDAGQYAHGLGD